MCPPLPPSRAFAPVRVQRFAQTPALERTILDLQFGWILCGSPIPPPPSPHSRVQRFAQTPVLKRTILELIAQELVKMMPPALSVHGSTQYAQ